MFDMQFIVTSRLGKEKHNVLRILRKNAERSDVEKFILEAKFAKDKDDLQNIDAVLQVSVAANRDLYEEIRKGARRPVDVWSARTVVKRRWMTCARH